MEVKQKIEKLIKENDVCLFMKVLLTLSMWVFDGCNKRIETS